ncbi:GNAT superfamily N-acetyltransferase [Kineosphaera limosa]|uniref:N-acetyltransferase domain-containing protein n=1 Tax=Kineosphaera limosa NBRC 100340 TaxID=1184609 RepID=K6WP09_9MICO|nr:GNAT family N-acetyltransferase [Kineosphaera limosa]NYD99907.1 GNAT superfamily N-acetyltransferase [Kineosphaera limosa]GAB95556.1 hypothetical protein KILIM_022_00410 [Kineosphaera limosa NBRC 100340]
MTAGLRVEPVRTRVQLREFIELPLRVHPAGMAVPLWQRTIQAWHDRPDVELWVARDATGTVVGRTTLHTDRRMDERIGGPTLLLGATEMASPAAFAALVEHARAQAATRGCAHLLGPVSLLPNQTGGVITSGWGERGFVDSPWNPAWYPDVWEAAGFTRCFTGATWICERLDAVGSDAFGAADAPPGVTLRYGSRSDLGTQVPMLRDLLNDSFAQLPYYTQITAQEMAEATDGLAHLLDERLLIWVEADGEPAAFVLVVPDLSRFVMSVDGRLGPLEAVRLLATRHRYRREAVLIVKGTRPQFQGRGLNRLLSRELLAGLHAGGYETLRSTFVGDDNPASAAQYERMGGRPLHGTTFYRLDLPSESP